MEKGDGGQDCCCSGALAGGRLGSLGDRSGSF